MDELEDWLNGSKPKTIGGLIEASGQKSFGLIFLVLMAIPATPLPTGGVTHVFEVIVMLLALEMIIGQNTIWLPKRWLNKPLGKTIQKRTLPYLLRKINWVKKHSRPRWRRLLGNREFLRFVGLAVLIFALGAFLSPPFSGLDTLPSMGAVAVALALILDDFAILAIGLVIGTAGLGVSIGFGELIVAGLRHWF